METRFNGSLRSAASEVPEKASPRTEGDAQNLSTYLATLNEGTNPAQIHFGFVHNEGKGVYALDQGGGKSLAESRMYLFPDVVSNVLWLLTIGDKSSQVRDIADTRSMIETIMKPSEKQTEEQLPTDMTLKIFSPESNGHE